MEYLLLIVPVILIGILVYRTIQFKPKEKQTIQTTWNIDKKKAYQGLSKLIQYPTVSYENKDLMDEHAFESLRNHLLESYPNIVKHSTYSLHKKGMLFHLTGTDDHDPIVLMSHYDVVPAQEGWKDNPFSGKITNTHIYGRGALDTKSSLNAIMQSVEYLLENGHVFKRDLYLAFGGDEETYGDSQIEIVNYLKEQNIKPFFVLDEGGAIVSNIFPGVQQKTAVIGIAEKGFLNIRLSAKSKGGHASTPPKITPIYSLSKAVTRLNNHPAFKLKLTTPVKALFDKIAPYSKSRVIRFLFANLWLFLPLVKWIAKRSGGEFLSLFKTTQAFTMSKGSQAINVIPDVASIDINYRLISGETSNDIVKRIKEIVRDPDILVEIMDVSEASTVSKLDERYALVENAILSTWKDVIAAPYLMIATSDSRRYHVISEHVYKFSPMDVSTKDLEKIHGFDEDITKENVIQGITFYLNLLSKI
ncbi:MAG: M20/M25/M40 family metallo-hydrolase [Acholeplasmataceae bacterium]|nr:M20/M25/M40 family metallo-hydrolase [Acholeplasmataceae bacterium]